MNVELTQDELKLIICVLEADGNIDAEALAENLKVAGGL